MTFFKEIILWKYIFKKENIKMRIFTLGLFLAFLSFESAGQAADSTKNISTFSGNIGFTNNGFSIIPTFSLNHSAFVTNFYSARKSLALSLTYVWCQMPKMEVCFGG